MGVDSLARLIKTAIDAHAAYLTRGKGIKYGYMRSDTTVEIEGKTYPVSPADNLGNLPFGYRGMVKAMISNGRAVIVG